MGVDHGARVRCRLLAAGPEHAVHQLRLYDSHETTRLCLLCHQSVLGVAKGCVKHSRLFCVPNCMCLYSVWRLVTGLVTTGGLLSLVFSVFIFGSMGPKRERQMGTAQATAPVVMMYCSSVTTAPDPLHAFPSVRLHPVSAHAASPGLDDSTGLRCGRLATGIQPYMAHA